MRFIKVDKLRIRKAKFNNSAVSEVVGTIIILTITVSLLTSVYIAAFALPPPSEAPKANIVGMTANENELIFTHQGGDDLSLDSIIIITIGGKEKKYTVRDLLDEKSVEDGFWNIGEELVFNYDIRGLQVEAKIIDRNTNSIVMMGLLQEGLLIRDPYVFTLNATDIQAMSAKLIMEYNFWDLSGSVRFSYRVTAGSWINTPWIALSGEDNYELIINGLNYETQYEYKAEITWGTNLTSGRIRSFITASPTIVTLDATDVQTRSAIIWRQYDFKGLSGSVSFSYRQNGGSWIDTPWVNTSGQGTCPETITNLIPKTLYEFKARIKYDGIIKDGNLKSFITWSIIMGMWHFSEGANSTAYDSSGLGNHGTIFGANWTIGVNTTALSFDGIDDYIRVYDSNSLDITQQLTVEAWIKPLEKSKGLIGDITDSLIDTSWFGPNSGRDSDIIQILGDIYAISFRGDDDDGYLVTFILSSNGTIKKIIDYLEFDTSYCYEPDIVHIVNDIYGIVYEGANNDGFVKTAEIFSDGQINDIVIDSLEFDTSNGQDASIIHINGYIYAIAYLGINGDGYVKSIEIADSGMITDSVVDTTIFFDTESGIQIAEPRIMHVGNNNYAIVFRNPDDDGEVRTITILDDGTFASSPFSDGFYSDKFVYDGYDSWSPDTTVTHINSNIYAVCYRGRDGKGALVTIDIDINGIIHQDLIDKFYFDDITCNDPKMIYVSGNYYAIVYRGIDGDGFLVIVEISGDGQISDSIIQSYEFDTSDCYKPIIIRYKGDFFIIAYTSNSEGLLKTVEITSAPEISPLHVSRYCIFDFIEPDIINVFNDVYAIVTQGLDGDGYLRTIQISNNGVISNSVIDVLEFDLIDGRDPVIINVAGSVYAIAYRGPNDDGFLKTVGILNDGDIKDDTVIGTFEFDSSYCFEPNIYPIAGNVYAIAYRGPDDDGFIKTVNIMNDGSILASPIIDTLEFDTTYCFEPDIIHIAGNVYAIAYRGLNDHGFIKTVVIMNNGDITNTIVDSFEYDTTRGYEPEIVHISEKIYAIVYSRETWGGYLATIEIEDSGVITKSVIDTFRFDNKQPDGDNDCFDPHIIHIDDWAYAVVYRGQYDGYVKTLRIGDSGDISDVNDDYLLFDVNGYEPQIIHIDGDIYAIPFSGSGSNAALKTVEIKPINANWPRPVVYKEDAYGLQSNGTTVFGHINSKTISAPLTSDFNHVVLIYNRSLSSNQMKLYINSILKDQVDESSTINTNGNNLIMGDEYNFVLDEVTIWNIALTDAQILDNYNLLKP